MDPYLTPPNLPQNSRKDTPDSTDGAGAEERRVAGRQGAASAAAQGGRGVHTLVERGRGRAADRTVLSEKWRKRSVAGVMWGCQTGYMKTPSQPLVTIAKHRVGVQFRCFKDGEGPLQRHATVESCGTVHARCSFGGGELQTSSIRVTVGKIAWHGIAWNPTPPTTYPLPLVWAPVRVVV